MRILTGSQQAALKIAVSTSGSDLGFVFDQFAALWRWEMLSPFVGGSVPVK